MQKLLETTDHACVLQSIHLICGAAIDDGRTVHLRGGCAKEVSAFAAYRCVDCTASFHRDCMREHLKDETEKDALIRTLEKENAAIHAFTPKKFPERESDEFDEGYRLAVVDMKIVVSLASSPSV